ncbi:hypothetical protein QMZ29_03775 [Serratia sp. PF-27]|uniref:hypothetical protein n=1 Tax=unclassified Serratia (in: enterobacteria) TaxID=2647522 RepID=UPI0024B6219D|nr:MULTISPECIES: hypothetical protein [unclassified Serratia (in: enterobacteria)]MDI9267147.1 hypothetical protein [Serratia sp. PF-27]
MDGTLCLNDGATDCRAAWFVAAVSRLASDERKRLRLPEELNADQVYAQQSDSFDRQVRNVITLFDLTCFFDFNRPGQQHQTIAPAAFDYEAGLVKPEEMKKWRAGYRKRSQIQQIMIATLIWLYQGKIKDTTWLRRVPCTWSLGDVLKTLHDKRMLSVWMNLIKSYNGW